MAEETKEEVKEVPKEEELKIEVVDDTPPEDKTPKKPVKAANGEDDDAELLNYSESVQKRINKLKRESHEQRRAKEAAERERAEAVQFAQRLMEENKQLQNRGTVDRGAMLANAEARITSQLGAAKQALKDAFAASDADKIAEANEAIAKLTVEGENVKRIKSHFAAQQQRMPQHPAATPLQDTDSGVQHQPTAPLRRPEPKAVEWAAKNTWFGRDPVMTGFAYGLHQKLVSDGVDPQSDEYYETINKTVRVKFPEEFADDANAVTDDSGEQTPPPKVAPKATPRPSTVVAPASRSTGGAKNVVLTASEVALARRLGLTNEQYAREKVRLAQGA